MTSSTFSFTAPSTVDVAKITLTGALTNSQIIAAGSVGSVTANSTAGSKIYAGVTPVDKDPAEYVREAEAEAGDGAGDPGHSAGSLRIGNLKKS